MHFWLLACAVAVAFGAEGESFTYNRCASNGPQDWGGYCHSQSAGSPIDLCGASLYPDIAPRLQLSESYFAARTMNIMNNGHTVQVAPVNNNPSLHAGNIASKVNRSTDSTANPEWVFAQMHYHVGRAGRVNEGSEHYMQGMAYPAELHLVHYNSARGGSLTEALESKQKDAVLVVGVFVAQGLTEAPIMTVIANAVATTTRNNTQLPTPVYLSDIFTGNGAYYTYGGSLTTPGCNEQVTWVVMQTPIWITLRSLILMKSASTEPPASSNIKPNPDAPRQSQYGTFRPLQPLNGRNLYFSAGATAACIKPLQSEFYCGPSPVITYWPNSAPAISFVNVKLLFAAFAVLSVFIW